LVSQDSPKLLTNDSPLNFFPTPSIFPKRHQPFPKSPLFWFSKIHILRLWTSPKDPQPLVSKYPKTSILWFPWDSPSLPNKWVMECLKSVSDLSKLCHTWESCATIIVYDPRYDILIQKSRHACTKSRHHLLSAETIHSATKIVPRLRKPRHDFQLSQHHNFESFLNKSPPWI